MILSISRRTDIPALYLPWLARRFREGWCEVPNPYNPAQVSRVSLRREDVDAIVFWTRHARPLLGFVPWLEQRGFPFLVQYTITGYGAPWERRTPPLDTACRTFRALAERRPAGSVVWRYDPILLGDPFPPASHVARFRGIAARLEGAAERVVVSVVDPYRKTRRRMGDALAVEPRARPELPDLLAALRDAAAEHGMAIEACAEEDGWTALGIAPTKCVDDRLLARCYGGTWPAAKDRGQRPACRCIPSRDIGMPDTCTFGCRYCYATRSDDLARRNRRAHDPDAARLFGHAAVRSARRSRPSGTRSA